MDKTKQVFKGTIEKFGQTLAQSEGALDYEDVVIKVHNDFEFSYVNESKIFPVCNCFTSVIATC